MSYAARAAVCLALLAPAARADEAVPSFNKEKDRESKAFVEKVGTAIVREARPSAQKPELQKYEYTKPKAGRTELRMKMGYTGAVTGVVSKKSYTADVVVVIDSSDASKWEVLNITYKDNSINLMKANQAKVQALIPKLNR